MWEKKKRKSEAPLPSVPLASKAPEINRSELASEAVEDVVMSINAIRPLVAAPVDFAAVLGVSHHVKGEISGNEDLHVDGSVEGLIQLGDRKLTVGTSGKVTADIVAGEIIVYGSVKGNLRACNRIEIKKDGSVVGELTTARIMIEDGAYFKGSIEIERKASDSDTGCEKERPYSLLGGKPLLQSPYPASR